MILRGHELDALVEDGEHSSWRIGVIGPSRGNVAAVLVELRTKTEELTPSRSSCVSSRDEATRTLRQEVASVRVAVAGAAEVGRNRTA
jgi:hypothetical protein